MKHTFLFVVVLVFPSVLHAEVFTLVASESGGNEEFENVANTLQPGDELILMDGEFSQTARRAITVVGTAENPIIIRAADGANPILTRPAAQIDQQNNIEIIDSSFVIFRGIHFRGGSIGVRFLGNTTSVTIEDCEVSMTGSNAISMNEVGATYDDLAVRRTHIHDTGLAPGNVEGEGLYVGCNDSGCVVRNSVFENNYIHTLRGTSGGGNDGIEIKPGSHDNIIRDNVIHDTNIGQAFPCIFVYGGGPGSNLVEGNVMWNCGEAIQVVSDAIIRNNIILTSEIRGITAGPHAQVPNVRNVEITNNTIYGHPQCVDLNWSNAVNVTFANNAIFCGGNEAVNIQGAGGIDGGGNYVEGTVVGAMVDGNLFSDGGSAASAFGDPDNFDFWPIPNSVLRDAASATFAPTLDFNGQVRTMPHDVGAYDGGSQVNPGWAIAGGFKSLNIARPGGDTGVNNGNNNSRSDGGGGSSGGTNPGLNNENVLPGPLQEKDSGCCATISTRATNVWFLWIGLLALVFRVDRRTKKRGDSPR